METIYIVSPKNPDNKHGIAFVSEKRSEIAKLILETHPKECGKAEVVGFLKRYCAIEFEAGEKAQHELVLFVMDLAHRFGADIKLIDDHRQVFSTDDELIAL